MHVLNLTQVIRLRIRRPSRPWLSLCWSLEAPDEPGGRTFSPREGGWRPLRPPGWDKCVSGLAPHCRAQGRRRGARNRTRSHERAEPDMRCHRSAPRSPRPCGLPAPSPDAPGQEASRHGRKKRLSRAHSQTAVPASLASEQLNHTGDSVGALRPAGTLVGPRRVKVHREGAGRGPGRGRALPRPSLGSCTAGPPAGTPGRDQALVTAGHGGRGGGHLLGIWQGRRVQCGVSASTAVCRQ